MHSAQQVEKEALKTENERMKLEIDLIKDQIKDGLLIKNSAASGANPQGDSLSNMLPISLNPSVVNQRPKPKTSIFNS